MILGVGMAAGWNLRRPGPRPASGRGRANPRSGAASRGGAGGTGKPQLRARMLELDKTLAAQQIQELGQDRGTAGKMPRTSRKPSRACNPKHPATRRDCSRPRPASRTGSSKQQLQGLTTSAEARARDAEQRIRQPTMNANWLSTGNRGSAKRRRLRIRQLEGENEKFRRVIDDQQRRIQQNTQLVAFFPSPNLKFYQYTGTRQRPVRQGARRDAERIEGSILRLPPAAIARRTDVPALADPRPESGDCERGRIPGGRGWQCRGAVFRCRDAQRRPPVRGDGRAERRQSRADRETISAGRRPSGTGHTLIRIAHSARMGVSERIPCNFLRTA